MKTCTKCGEVKTPEEFNKNSRAKDGLGWHCKKCVNANRAAWHSFNPGRNAASNKKWRDENKERNVSRIAAWRKANRDKLAAVRAKRREGQESRPKYLARMAAGTAIHSGKLQRQPCEICGSEVGVEAHHDDYSKPLEVRWLCSQHHREWHKHNTPINVTLEKASA